MRAGLLVLLALLGSGARAAQPKDLSVGVILTDGSRASLRRLSEYYREQAPHRLRPEVDSAVRFFGEVTAVFPRRFKSAPKLERREDAAEAGADVIALVDVAVEFEKGWGRKEKARVALRADFEDLQGRALGSAQAEAEEEPIVEARVRVRDDLYRELERALSRAVKGLEEALPGVEGLASVVPGSGPRSVEAPRAVHSRVDEALLRQESDPRKAAVVFGSGARWAERDASAVRAQLLGLGFPASKVLLLSGPRARASDLERALERWLPEQGALSTAVLYFSGRGALDRGAGEAFLLDAETDPASPRRGGLSVERALALLGAAKAERRFAVIDACFSGRAERCPAAPPSTPERPLAAEGVWTLAAASPGQPALSDDAEGHGLLTHRFLVALSSADPAGRVAAADAARRAAAEVALAARAGGFEQAPSWTGPGEWTWVEPARGARRVETIRPRPYEDERLTAKVPDGVFLAEEADDGGEATRFFVLDGGVPDRSQFVEVLLPESAPPAAEWRRRLASRFDLLHTRGWRETRAPMRLSFPWLEERIRFEGDGAAGWVLLGRSSGRPVRVVVRFRPGEEEWVWPRVAVILSSLEAVPVKTGR